MYLVFEGIDGCGKTTIISALAKRLSKIGYTSICLFEPTFGKFGLAGRQLIKAENGAPPQELLNLFSKDRREHVKNKINPALKFISKQSGFCILQDRGYLSAAAYHAPNDQAIWEILENQKDISPMPDNFILIDTPIAVAIDRIKRRSFSRSVFDNSDALTDIRSRYLAIAENSDIPIQIFDGSLPIDNIVDEVIDIYDLTRTIE